MTVRLCQRISRPIINLFVSRDRYDGFTQAQGTEVFILIFFISRLLVKMFQMCFIIYVPIRSYF